MAEFFLLHENQRIYFYQERSQLHYPFLEAIQSILPVCDEMMVAGGQQ